MRKRRVLVFNHFAVPAGEAGGTRHTELFGALPGWDHLIVAARTNPSTQRVQADQPGFRFVPVSPYSGNGLARIFNWASYAATATWASLRLWRRRPDVVYASSPHLLAGLTGALVATAYGRPFVLEVRDLWPKVLVDMGQLTAESPVYRGLAVLERYLYRRADQIVVLAEGVRTALLEAGVPADKVTTIPNAADPEFFEVALSREAARSRYGFDRTTFVYTGAHGPANGLDLLLDAARELPREDVEIVLVGDGVSKPALVARADALGLTNVRFLPPIPKSEIPLLLKAADVGVHCLSDVPLFRYGVSPNKVFDYLAAGKPVLTNTPGDVSALVRETGAGVAVEPTGLTAGIVTMADASHTQRAAWSDNGRQFMASHQSRRAMAARLLAILDGLPKEVTTRDISQ